MMKTPPFLSLNRFLLMLCFAAVPLYAGHHVAENGKAQMAVIYKKCTNPKEQAWDHVFRRNNTPEFAAKELAEHLEKISDCGRSQMG